MKATLNPRHQRRTQPFCIVAQDPSVKTANGRILTAIVEVPFEQLDPGPTGYRVQVIDYDASADVLLQPWQAQGPGDSIPDDTTILTDPRFHQQNVYAIVMRTLARFEKALGRRVAWSFGGHQLKVAPHTFLDANAFYAKADEALYFGYFAAPKKGGGMEPVFSCLSHDIVAHETSHALLDGLRDKYTYPSSPDQAAFHEGFSDIVAMLSVFSLTEVVRSLLMAGKTTKSGSRVAAKLLGGKALSKAALFSLAEEFGSRLANRPGVALRRSAMLKPDPEILNLPEFAEPHRRGEVLVAAMLSTMIQLLVSRLAELRKDKGTLDLSRVVEECQRIADRLLTMSIRAVDYCPPVHLEFGDYLSALLTADREIQPDDSVYAFRSKLREGFASYGIHPKSKGSSEELGVWDPPEEGANLIQYDGSHFQSMQHDPGEVFRFIWGNRKTLDLMDGAFTKVLSVRPCQRIGSDGFVLHETVAEYYQVLRLRPDELATNGYRHPGPELMPDNIEVALYGGGVLVFDEYGQLKFHIHNHLNNTKLQNNRIQYLAAQGFYLDQAPVRRTASKASPFGVMHLHRAIDEAPQRYEGCHHSSNPSHSHSETEPTQEDET